MASRVFTSQTGKLIRNLHVCPQEKGGKDLSPSSIARTTNEQLGKVYILFVHLHDSIPKDVDLEGFSLRALISEAILAWVDELPNLHATFELNGEPVSEKDANIVIKWGAIDGSSGKLAVANVGPPTLGQQLLLDTMAK